MTTLELSMLAETGAVLGFLERALAVVGGAVLGGFLMGLLVQFGARLVAVQNLPRWVLLVVRLLGAVITGWLVAMLVFGTGGGGWGWGKGGSGEETGTGTSTAPAVATQPQVTTERVLPEGTVLGVDVLGQQAVSQVLSDKDFIDGRCFRIPGQKELLNPDKLKEYLLTQKQKNAKLERVELRRVSEDSSDPSTKLLRGIKEWGKENKLDVSVVDSKTSGAK